MYRLFGFRFRAKLSTRPPHFVGDAATWDAAEAALGAALRAFLERGGGGAGAAAAEVEVDAGGGAFYGPKVDVFVRDALGREHQCATVQLDFQLPRRFGLRYRVARGGAEEGGEGGPTAVPVLIHRAVLGSIERMLGILAEHTAGKWPFWVSPRQVLVCTVAERHAGYAERLAAALRFPAPHRDTCSWKKPGGTV
jgi:threonyl-tRNA synthetase